jgi:hypothetical protein
VQKDAVRSSNSCIVHELADPSAASLPERTGSDAAPPAYVWLLRLRSAASGHLAGARGVRAVPAVGVWRWPPLAGLALPRQATRCHVEVLSAASDPSTRSVWHALFFCVPPHARSPPHPFHTTPPQGPSRLMKLPTDPCKDLRSFLWCTYEQVDGVVITMDHLEHTQRPS